MAFSIDTTTLVSLGNAYQISGTYTSVTSLAEEAIFPKGYILSFSVDRNESDDDMLVSWVHINSSDHSSTVANGSIAHLDTTAGDTIAWTATYK